MIASTALLSRTTRAPTPLGAPILCPDNVSIVQGTCRNETATLPKACTASVWSVTPAAQQRAAISAIGWITPISLLTHMTDTTEGCCGQRCIERIRIQDALPVDGDDDFPPAEAAYGMCRGQYRLVLDRRDRRHTSRRLAGEPRARRPRSRGCRPRYRPR